MTDIRTLLQPELEEELGKTRKMIDYLPDGHQDFKPHERSSPFARLAGHTCDIPNFGTMILTTPGYDIGGGTPRKGLVYETIPQLLAEFNERADTLLTALKNTSDDTFEQTWKMTYKEHSIFNGTRYEAYRAMCLNHMIHHRAQLGVYLRLLDCKVPGTFGPSADEPFGS